MNQDKPFKEKEIERLVVDPTPGENSAETLLDQATDEFHSQEKKLLPGTLIAGHYEIIATLGEGTTGTVYKARHLLLDSVRAIKLIHPVFSNNDKVLRRFQQEAKAAAPLEHPNIVRVYEFGIEEKLQQPYLVMDYVEGKPLNTILENEGPLDAMRASALIGQVCDGIAHAHSMGVIHRDIKPGNIILTDDSKAKIVDFGIAKLTTPEEGQNLTQTGEVFGTPLYMSPEQCLGRKVDARSDIYSLGCVLYECLTGKPPFQGASALETIMMHVNQDQLPDFRGERVPSYLEDAVHRAMEVNPERRFESMSEMKAAVTAARASDVSSISLSKFKRLRQNLPLQVVLLVILQIAYIAVKNSVVMPAQSVLTWIIFVLSAPLLLNILVATTDKSLVPRGIAEIKSLRRRLRTKSNRLLAVFLLTVLIVGTYTIAYIGLSAKVFWDRREIQRLKAELIAEKRNDPIAWLGIAHELEQKGDLVDAERAFRRSIQLKPDYKPAWLGLADILKKQRRTKDAEAALRRANELK
ncbi:MAG TPA: protein kinase [Candidatus Obscuribacterales bacterium]